MINALATLLLFQLAGETLSRLAHLPVPGPVIGMGLLVATLALRPALAEVITPTARFLLAHLSLMFVPAGVGIVGHLPTLANHAGPLAAAILGSTLLAIVAGAGTFRLVQRWLA